MNILNLLMYKKSFVTMAVCPCKTFNIINNFSYNQHFGKIQMQVRILFEDITCTSKIENVVGMKDTLNWRIHISQLDANSPLLAFR